MGQNKRVGSRETGLEIGLLLGRFFQNSEDLHYGYWHDGLEIEFSNFARAQQRHSEIIISNIPENTKTVLDVGAGAGGLAKRLLDNGYEVDCVSPSEFLSNKLSEKLGERSLIYRCKFEELETDKKYDLVLFSESFQYINMEKGLNKTLSLLEDNKHLLICDFFRTDAEGKNPLQAGHKLSEFYEKIGNSEFENLKDIDITRETAPTIQMLDEFLTDCLLPITRLGSKYLKGNFPLLMKIVNWKYTEKLNKIKKNYLSGQMNVDAYLKYENYRLLLYRKTV